MRTFFALPLLLALSILPPSVLAQKETNVADQRRTADAVKIVKLIDSLRPYCAKPRDQFETRESALKRTMAGFESPSLEFAIRPILYRADVREVIYPGPRGGQDFGATRYDPEKQQLSVRFPFYPGRTHSLVKEDPFQSAKAPPTQYVLVGVAADMRNLPSYRASNAFGVTMEVSHSRETSYLLAFTDPQDLEKLKLSRRDGILVDTFTTQMDTASARAIAPWLEWRVKASVQPIEGAECLVDRLEYTSRRPSMEDPWREEIVEYVLPVRLGSIELADKRTGSVLWSTEHAPAPSR